MSIAAIAASALLSDAPLVHLATLGLFTLVAAGVGVRLAVEPGAARTAELVRSLEALEQQIEAATAQRHSMLLRAETAGRFREEFVAAVRHELKTPLNAILGFTEVLLEGIDGPLTEQQREDVRAIREAGLYLSELVEAVLQEWVPNRATPRPLAPVELPPLVREVARLLEGQAAAKRVAVRCEVAPDLPRPLADARRLRQVLINLGTNALRATARGSITLVAAPHPDGVRLAVRDTGSGIAKEDLPSLFGEFESKSGGTGLGLALTRDLVEWHGGRVEVETAAGEGTTFHVVLPLEPE